MNLHVYTQPLASAVDRGCMLDHERLRVYQLSLEVATQAKRIIDKLPKGSAKLADQLWRSSTSILANIAEGVGKRSTAERRHCYDIARGSAMETAAHLDVVRLLETVGADDIDKVKGMIVEVVKMLSAMTR